MLGADGFNNQYLIGNDVHIKREKRAKCKKTKQTENQNTNMKISSSHENLQTEAFHKN